MTYKIDFAESVKVHMEALSAHQRSIVLDAIQRQLTHEPLKETHNRKMLRPNPVAPWELRKGNLRVFYEVAASAPDVVRILAVGWKEGNTLFIGDEEMKL